MATQTDPSTRFALVHRPELTPAEKAVEVLAALWAALTHAEEDTDARTTTDRDDS